MQADFFGIGVQMFVITIVYIHTAFHANQELRTNIKVALYGLFIINMML